MSILRLLSNDNFIAVNKDIASEVGLEAAVIFGELASEFVYWQNHDGLKDGYFYSTVENLEKKTFLSGHSQRQALAKLQEKGWIDITKKGIPAKRYIRLNEEEITSYFNDLSLKILTTGDKNIEEQDIKNFNGNKNISNNNIEENHDIYISDKAKKKTSSMPPKLEEIEDYCFERQNDIDPQHFYDYYTSNGWKVGKNPMKDWKAAVRTWERNSNGKPINSSQGHKKSTGNEFLDLLNKWEDEDE